MACSCSSIIALEYQAALENIFPNTMIVIH